MELKVQISKETEAALKTLAIGKESVNQTCARFLKDVSEAPRAEDITDHRALLGPGWLHDLGSDFDREISKKHFDNEASSGVARISAVRNTLGIKAFRRQGKPRKYTNDDRLQIWSKIEDLPFSNTAVMGGLGFRKASDCIDWAKENNLQGLVDRIEKTLKK